MSKILEDIYAKFGNSKAIFNVASDGSSLKFEQKETYRPSILGITDPVEIIMARHFREELSLSSGKFVPVNTCSNVFASIMDSVIKFYLLHSPLKNPKQSNMYKWLRDIHGRYNHSSADSFIALYRYIVTHGTETLSFSGGKRNTQAINALAILDRMKDKYGSSSN